MQRGVFFSQHVVIVHLHALIHHSRLDIIVLFTRRKWVVGIILLVPFKATLSIAFPSLSNVIAGCEHWRWGTVLSVTDEVAVVETPSP